MERLKRAQRPPFITSLLVTFAMVLAGCGGGANTSSAIPSVNTSGRATTTTLSARTTLLQENWTPFPTGSAWNDGGVYGAWTDQYGGYGTVEVVATTIDHVLSLSPKASIRSSETHAALVTSNASFGNFDATVHLTTVAQLRTSTPNPWEVGWVLWHYTDDSHFYSLNLKPNGWELGKEDPAYPGEQRYLRTASSPKFPIGITYAVRVLQIGATMTVYVNGTKLVSYADQQRPYASGFLGLYCEDAHVQFGVVNVSAM